MKEKPLTRLTRLKQDYLYSFTNEFSKVNVVITRTFPLSDTFKGESLTSPQTWYNSLAQVQDHWRITEMGVKEEYPEYFL